MRRIHLVTILVLLALALPASPAHAGGVVSVCDEAHLRAALAGGGTVTFTCSGTITLTSAITIRTATTLDGSGQTVTIDGNNAVQVFIVNERVIFNLDELTVAYGSADFGAGISNQLGRVFVSNSSFFSNRAISGGGIFNDFGILEVINSTLSDNCASSGGGIDNEGGTVTVSNSTFSNNRALDGDGGAIHNSNGTMTVSNSTFSGNNAEGTLGYGGGIYNYYQGTMLTVSNSTFSDNSASGGGGIFNLGATVNVSNSTFSDNSAYTGGGVFNLGAVTIKNTVVANSPTGENCAGDISDGGGNLSYPDTTCPGVNADPVLGPLQDNGGPTWTMALLPGSAAIDAAVDATCAAAPVNNLDQRGIARLQGAHCDIGAVEQYCPSFVPPGTVGAEDIVAIATRWGWTDATPGWDPVYDLNGDNRIDVVDILLVTRVWGGTCS